MILDKFNLDPSTYDRFCIEQKLPSRSESISKLFSFVTLKTDRLEILIPDQCNVFYALARPMADEQVELIVREKTRQEREQKKPPLIPDTIGHHRTPSGLSVSSAHSR